MIFVKIFWTINPIAVIDFFWCITSSDVESRVNDRSKKWFTFKLRKLIGKKKRHWSKFWKSFQLFLMNKFWFMNRFLYFFINAHAQIEKLIAKIKSITWNAWMEISMTTSFGVKCGVKDLALLSVYPSSFRYLGQVYPNWPNAPNTLTQV